jgi:hypothetical protein
MAKIKYLLWHIKINLEAWPLITFELGFRPSTLKKKLLEEIMRGLTSLIGSTDQCRCAVSTELMERMGSDSLDMAKHWFCWSVMS